MCEKCLEKEYRKKMDEASIDAKLGKYATWIIYLIAAFAAVLGAWQFVLAVVLVFVAASYLVLNKMREEQRAHSLNENYLVELGFRKEEMRRKRR